MKNKTLFTKRLKITILLLVIYYLLALIPIPFVKTDTDSGGQFLSTIASINGASSIGLKLFSLGLMPYFMSTLVLKLLTQSISPSLKELSNGTQEQREKYEKISDLIFYVIAFLQSISFLYIKIGQPNVLQILITWDGILSILMLFTGAVLSKTIADQITNKGLANGFILVIALMLGYETIKNMYYLVLESNNLVVGLGCLMMLILIFISAIMIQRFSYRVPVTIDLPTSLIVSSTRFTENNFKISLMCIGISPIVYFSFISPVFELIGIYNVTVLTVVSFVAIYLLTILSVKADYKAERIVDLFISKGITIKSEMPSRKIMVQKLNKLFTNIITINTLTLFGFYMLPTIFKYVPGFAPLTKSNINGIQILMLSYVVLEIFSTINAYFVKEAPQLIY